MVVSDLHMPVRGDVVLERFRERFPAAVRILISGGGEIDGLMQSVGPAHRHLAKPCQGEEIEEALQGALALRCYLADPALGGAFERMGRRPLFPTGPDEQVDPMRERLRRLDLRQPERLAAEIFDQLQIKTAQAIDADAFWHDAEAAADRAQRICDQERITHALRAHAVTASYLHRLGALLTARYAEEASARDALQADDAVASHLLSLWGLPDAVSEAIAFHRIPSRAPTRSRCALTIVHAAWALAGADGATLDAAYIEQSGLQDHVVHWRRA
jgi:hypothetical protein